MAEKPFLRVDPPTRLAAARQLLGKEVTITVWYHGRKDLESQRTGRVLGCSPGARSGASDMIILDTGVIRGRGYLTAISLAEVAYIHVDGQVITGNGVRDA